MPGMVVRASHAATTITTARVGGASGTVMVSTPQHYAVPVSYTHLTLPTSDLV